MKSGRVYEIIVASKKIYVLTFKIYKIKGVEWGSPSNKTYGKTKKLSKRNLTILTILVSRISYLRSKPPQFRNALFFFIYFKCYVPNLFVYLVRFPYFYNYVTVSSNNGKESSLYNDHINVYLTKW